MRWHDSMLQTFEFYTVDPNTLKDMEKLTEIEECSIVRDSTTSTKYSAQFHGGMLLKESYVRVYLVCEQDRIKERFPLGTFLIQTESDTYDGKYTKYSMVGYSPLLELVDDLPPIGFSILALTEEGAPSIEELVFHLIRDNSRLNVIKPSETGKVLLKNYVASVDESFLDTANNLLSYNEEELILDEMGNVLIDKLVSLDSMTPKWKFTDDDKSILYPEFDNEYDVYGLPNVVEVIYSGTGGPKYCEIKNEDPNHPLSIQNRGRIVRLRITDPEFYAVPTDTEMYLYAKKTLDDANTITRTVTIKHGYCGVTIGDCVLLNYERKGLKDIKARIVRQNINCVPGTPVESTCVYTEKIYERKGTLL